MADVPPSAGDAEAPHVLYVVSRDRPEVYQRLKRQINDASVKVVFDRRERERRGKPRPIETELRRAERRIADIQSDLASRGWAILYLSPGRADRLGPGDRVVLRRYNPMLPQRLIGKTARLLDIRRVRAEVQFEGEDRTRSVDITDLGPRPTS